MQHVCVWWTLFDPVIAFLLLFMSKDYIFIQSVWDDRCGISGNNPRIYSNFCHQLCSSANETVWISVQRYLQLRQANDVSLYRDSTSGMDSATTEWSSFLTSSVTGQSQKIKLDIVSQYWRVSKYFGWKLLPIYEDIQPISVFDCYLSLLDSDFHKQS